MQTLGYYVDLLVESSNVCQVQSAHNPPRRGHMPRTASFTAADPYGTRTRDQSCEQQCLLPSATQAKSCVMDLATSLRVTLDPDLFSIYVVHKEGYRIFAGPYDLFFALGNEKHPPVFAVGRINMFMCQFPFDLDRQVPPILVEVRTCICVCVCVCVCVCECLGTGCKAKESHSFPIKLSLQ